MTLPMARELASSGIRVVTVPRESSLRPCSRDCRRKRRRRSASRCPSLRASAPEEYAKLVQSIVENPMLNGETIRLDGAIRMAPR